MTPKTPKVASPICPKCGYDQGGIVSSWTDRCPLEGRCTECGLDFAWADVMDPKRVYARWHAECMRTRRQVALYPFGMLLRLFLPWMYWERTSRLSHHRLAWLAGWLISVAVWMHLIVSGIFFVMQFESSRLSSWKSVWSGGIVLVRTRPSVGEFVRGVDPIWWIDSATVSLTDIGAKSLNISMLWGEVAFAYGIIMFFASVSWLVLMGGLLATRREFNIAWRDLMRAFLLSLIALVVMYEFGRLVSITDHYLMLAHSIDWINMDGGNYLLLGAAFVLFLWIQACWLSAIRVGWFHRPAWGLCGLGFIFSALGGVALTMAFVSLFL